MHLFMFIAAPPAVRESELHLVRAQALKQRRVYSSAEAYLRESVWKMSGHNELISQAPFTI